MRDIPKQEWIMTLDNWYDKIKDLIRHGVIPAVRTSGCGYCKHFKDSWDEYGENCRCPLKNINVCGREKSPVQKIVKEYYKSVIQHPKLALRWSRQILQAIIDDGRRLGYVGEKEEVKIKEVMG